MKIYTKTGDNGTTSLVGGTRISKADLRLEAYGTADELNSFVGLLRAKQADKQIDDWLHFVQNKLFNLGAQLATEDDKMHLIEQMIIQREHVEYIEQAIDKMEGEMPPIHSFILPAGSEAVAIAHVCRTVCRRLERLMVGMKEKQNDENFAILLKFVNRLSDFLFILAKKIAKNEGCDIFLWEK